MKHQILRALFIVGFAAAAASLVNAQSVDTYRAHVPFDFQIGKKIFAAGDYRVEVRGDASGFFVLRTADGSDSYAVATSPADRVKSLSAKLDFHRYSNGRYVLAGITASSRLAQLPAPVKARMADREVPKSVMVALTSRVAGR